MISDLEPSSAACNPVQRAGGISTRLVLVLLLLLPPPRAGSSHSRHWLRNMPP
eukprot:CAMPEP_0206506998 /NCGR_PEP_ID=MMETSP0324_2-20121206/57216_1 /ASSEMBLY_ACC=CAM_ASM_000836 /TAXON_ID=2866 /ORGANISM="Crypthecodinium cohnii, Strain Seligo" /LENGTH=52 /DNA_ID=CAMNT_0053997069 /DNA_START=84 /DNA_END=239 /DNA_ORIENTATION=-